MNIGIIGGSGMYILLEGADEIQKETEYGNTSDNINIGNINEVKVAFIPRHGKNHIIPPHRVPYKANIEALAGMGVERIIATNAVGSLNPDYKPGDFVIFDQFMNFTSNRDDTFFNGPRVVHISTAEAFCPELRGLAISKAKSMGLSLHEKGTVAVINGPRFSSKAESKYFRNTGADMVNMTLYPEIALAREKAMCYLGIGIVTDYDSGLEGDPGIKPVDYQEVGRMFSANVPKLKELITAIVNEVPATRNSCNCSKSLEGAEVKV
ncbi:MAG: MTAP family purine nucleoside phosphorylase [Candidatus Micrarchaeaceae archaeon]